jgi:hypothetical protein
MKVRQRMTGGKLTGLNNGLFYVQYMCKDVVYNVQCTTMEHGASTIWRDG